MSDNTNAGGPLAQGFYHTWSAAQEARRNAIEAQRRVVAEVEAKRVPVAEAYAAAAGRWQAANRLARACEEWLHGQRADVPQRAPRVTNESTAIEPPPRP